MLIFKGMIIRSVVEQSRLVLAVTCNCAVDIMAAIGTEEHIPI